MRIAAARDGDVGPHCFPADALRSGFYAPKSDIARSYFQQFGEPLAALGKWSVAQAGSFQADQIEGVVNNRNFLIASVGLEELKRRFPFIVKRSDLAVDDGLLSR
jgi:hypothetical protein